ncbi:hypothetical protein B0T25DRAFT_520469 [Lasiosphaeria hispida]|uniref:Uncharacterized protein n=1 Tax=Lasiosphaeria hispida TaxID=260671 RepID=A0AAJ0MAA7_9PEZI|nr:hypothetical protein B0T25DRAFT_520469 [Lasiosphaeria hispida]
MTNTGWEDLVPGHIPLQEVAKELENDGIPHPHLDKLAVHHVQMIRRKWEAKQQLEAEKNPKTEPKQRVDQKAGNVTHPENTAGKTAQRNLTENRTEKEETALATALERSRITPKHGQSRNQTPALEETDRLWKQYHEAIRERLDDEAKEARHEQASRKPEAKVDSKALSDGAPSLVAQLKPILKKAKCDDSATRARSVDITGKSVKFSDPVTTPRSTSDKHLQQYPGLSRTLSMAHLQHSWETVLPAIGLIERTPQPRAGPVPAKQANSRQLHRTQPPPRATADQELRAV